MYSAVCFVFSFALQPMARALSRRRTHGFCQVAGALGLLSVAVIHNKSPLLLSMTGIGIAWASTLSMPYAMLAGSLPAKRVGLYMGIFNLFIVLPEIGASLGFGWVIDRKSTRLNSSHANISYAVFCLKKKKHLSPLSSTSRDSFCRSTDAPTQLTR